MSNSTNRYFGRREKIFRGPGRIKSEIFRLLSRQVITQHNYKKQYQIINDEQQNSTLEDMLPKEDTEANIYESKRKFKALSAFSSKAKKLFGAS